MNFFDIQTQYPITIKGMNDNNGNGIIEDFNLHTSKALYHMHIYMFFKWGIEFEFSEDKIPCLTFKSDKILYSFDDESKRLKNVVLHIEDYDTFEKFLDMFKDDFYYLKHAKKNIKFYNKSDDVPYYIGTELEVILDEEHDNPDDRRRFIECLEERYGDVTFSQTECFNRQFIELNNYPSPLIDIYRVVHIVDYMKTLGATVSWSCSFQTHVGKEAFGDNIEEAKKRINKIVMFMYNIDEFIKTQMYNDRIVDWQICPTFKDLIHHKRFLGIEKLETDNLVDLIYSHKEQYDSRGLAPYYVNFPRLLEDYEHEPTLEFRIAGFNSMSHEWVWMPIALTDYCVNVVMFMDLEDVKKLTIDDFYKFYENKKEELYKLGDYGC